MSWQTKYPLLTTAVVRLYTVMQKYSVYQTQTYFDKKNVLSFFFNSLFYGRWLTCASQQQLSDNSPVLLQQAAPLDSIQTFKRHGLFYYNDISFMQKNSAEVQTRTTKEARAHTDTREHLGHPPNISIQTDILGLVLTYIPMLISILIHTGRGERHRKKERKEREGKQKRKSSGTLWSLGNLRVKGRVSLDLKRIFCGFIDFVSLWWRCWDIKDMNTKSKSLIL